MKLFIHRLALGLVLCCLVTPTLAAKDSSSVVKVSAKAGKIDADGNQEIVLTVDVAKKWHVYANPVGNSTLKGAQTTVTVKSKVQSSKVKYPVGHLVKDEILGDYFTYEGKSTIKVKVQRNKGDTSPIDLVVFVQACDANQCLVGAKIKVSAK